MKKSRKLKKRLKVIILLLLIVATAKVLYKPKGKTVIDLNTINVQNSVSNDKDWNLILVNKWNKMPENYNVNLVEVSSGQKVDKRIYEPLMEMLNDAKKVNLGRLPLVVAGYRTTEKQQQLYDDKIKEFVKSGYSKKDATEEAGKWVSIPGYSEHQLGLAVDINGETTELYSWLEENSYKYGFILRYPGKKSNITGILNEEWHYRYVGKEVASKIYKQKLCLEEYLEQ